MKIIFRCLFRRKNGFAIDCEAYGPDGSRVISIRDATGIIREIGIDYNRLTEVLHSMPVKATNLGETNPVIIKQHQELWEWNMVARQLHANIGYGIHQLDGLIAQNLQEIMK